MHRTVGRVQISSWLPGLILGLAALGCESGGVGEPCVPEDEYQTRFSGFAVTEVNVESRSFQCETRLCLVNHFQGRVSCRLGQSESEATARDADGKDAAAWNPKCSIPGTAVNRADRDSADNIRVAVPAQLKDRQAERAVYCSCRCDGPDKKARYCECPDGFQCEPLVDDLPVGNGGDQLAGSYCIRSGSKWKPAVEVPTATNCLADPAACGCTGDPYDAECGTK